MMQPTLLSSMILMWGLSASSNANAAAGVNVQEGSLVWKKSEMLIASPDERLAWERSYSSRSDAAGLLGLGWCTEFEWRLSFAEGEAWLQKCDDIERVPSARVRKRGRETLIREGAHELIFSPAGELEGFLTKRTQTWLLQRDLARRPTGLLSPGGNLAVFRYDDLSHLTRLKAAVSNWDFRYARNLLAAVTAEPGENEKYEYDQTLNLTRVQSDGQKKLAATYDTAKDLVETVEEQGCRSQYKYSSQNGAGFVNDQVLETRACLGRSPRLTEHRFRYQKLSGHRVRLFERSSRIDGD